MPELISTDDLETWTDRTAHREWLEVRHGVTQAEFSLPEDVRNDAVARLHQIIRYGLGEKITSTDRDKNAIAAVLALAKLATTTTATVTARATMLSKHIAHQDPLATDAHSVQMRKIINGMMEPEPAE